jgi:hypothetical protein
MFPSLPFKIQPVTLDEVISSVAEGSKKFLASHIQRTPERVRAEAHSSLVASGEGESQLSHPS